MKIATMVVCLCLALGTWATAQQAESDTAPCELCQALSHVNRLMEDVKVETKLIDNGMISVMVVPESIKEALAATQKEVHAVVNRKKAGRSVKLGEACTAMFEQPRLKGAKLQRYKTGSARVMLVTSDDEAVVNEIHQTAGDGQPGRATTDVQRLVGSSRLCGQSNCIWTGYCLKCGAEYYGCGWWVFRIARTNVTQGCVNVRFASIHSTLG